MLNLNIKGRLQAWYNILIDVIISCERITENGIDYEVKWICNLLAISSLQSLLATYNIISHILFVSLEHPMPLLQSLMATCNIISHILFVSRKLPMPLLQSLMATYNIISQILFVSLKLPIPLLLPLTVIYNIIYILFYKMRLTHGGSVGGCIWWHQCGDKMRIVI